MGSTLAFKEPVIGLLGAASQSSAYSAAAQQQREEAIYNSRIARYNGEVAANETTYNAEAEQHQLTRSSELAQRNNSHKQASLMFDGQQQAGMSRAALAASGADSPLGEQAILEGEKRNFLQRQSEQEATDYASSMFAYKAGQTGKAAVSTAFNQRQQALFQGASALGSGFAKAAEYDQMSSNAFTTGILSSAVGIGGVAMSSGIFSGGAPGAGDISPSGGVFGPPIQAPSAYGGNFADSSSLFGGY